MNRNLCFVVAWLALVHSSPVLAAWTPPANPDPSTILHEARDDTRAGRYEDALAKHVWYHENALKLDRAQFGVRLSFALGYWEELAEKYPPAAKKLEEIRVQARKAVLAKDAKRVFENFADFAALSERSGKGKEIVELFAALDKKDAKLARQAYNSAEDALIEAGEYKLLGKYVEGDPAMDREIELLNHHREMAKRGVGGADIGAYGEQTFRRDASTIVAILVKCDRSEEAKRAAAKAREAWDDAELHAAVDRALKGEAPPRR